MEPPPSASPALTDAKTRSLSLKGFSFSFFIFWFSLCPRIPVGNDVDVPPAAVTAGKREYQTVGKMEITL